MLPKVKLTQLPGTKVYKQAIVDAQSSISPHSSRKHEEFLWSCLLCLNQRGVRNSVICAFRTQHSVSTSRVLAMTRHIYFIVETLRYNAYPLRSLGTAALVSNPASPPSISKDPVTQICFVAPYTLVRCSDDHCAL